MKRRSVNFTSGALPDTATAEPSRPRGPDAPVPPLVSRLSGDAAALVPHVPPSPGSPHDPPPRYAPRSDGRGAFFSLSRFAAERAARPDLPPAPVLAPQPSCGVAPGVSSGTVPAGPLGAVSHFASLSFSGARPQAVAPELFSAFTPAAPAAHPPEEQHVWDGAEPAAPAPLDDEPQGADRSSGPSDGGPISAAEAALLLTATQRRPEPRSFEFSHPQLRAAFLAGALRAVGQDLQAIKHDQRRHSLGAMLFPASPQAALDADAGSVAPSRARTVSASGSRSVRSPSRGQPEQAAGAADDDELAAAIAHSVADTDRRRRARARGGVLPAAACGPGPGSVAAVPPELCGPPKRRSVVIQEAVIDDAVERAVREACRCELADLAGPDTPEVRRARAVGQSLARHPLVREVLRDAVEYVLSELAAVLPPPVLAIPVPAALQPAPAERAHLAARRGRVSRKVGGGVKASHPGQAVCDASGLWYTVLQPEPPCPPRHLRIPQKFATRVTAAERAAILPLAHYFRAVNRGGAGDSSDSDDDGPASVGGTRIGGGSVGKKRRPRPGFSLSASYASVVSTGDSDLGRSRGDATRRRGERLDDLARRYVALVWSYAGHSARDPTVSVLPQALAIAARTLLQDRRTRAVTAAFAPKPPQGPVAPRTPGAHPRFPAPGIAVTGPMAGLDASVSLPPDRVGSRAREASMSPTHNAASTTAQAKFWSDSQRGHNAVLSRTERQQYHASLLSRHQRVFDEAMVLVQRDLVCLFSGIDARAQNPQIAAAALLVDPTTSRQTVEATVDAMATRSAHASLEQQQRHLSAAAASARTSPSGAPPLDPLGRSDSISSPLSTRGGVVVAGRLQRSQRAGLEEDQPGLAAGVSALALRPPPQFPWQLCADGVTTYAELKRSVAVLQRRARMEEADAAREGEADGRADRGGGDTQALPFIAFSPGAQGGPAPPSARAPRTPRASGQGTREARVGGASLSVSFNTAGEGPRTPQLPSGQGRRRSSLMTSHVTAAVFGGLLHDGGESERPRPMAELDGEVATPRRGTMRSSPRPSVSPRSRHSRASPPKPVSAGPTAQQLYGADRAMYPQAVARAVGNVRFKEQDVSAVTAASARRRSTATWLTALATPKHSVSGPLPDPSAACDLAVPSLRRRSSAPAVATDGGARRQAVRRVRQRATRAEPRPGERELKGQALLVSIVGRLAGAAVEKFRTQALHTLPRPPAPPGSTSRVQPSHLARSMLPSAAATGEAAEQSAWYETGRRYGPAVHSGDMPYAFFDTTTVSPLVRLYLAGGAAPRAPDDRGASVDEPLMARAPRTPRATQHSPRSPSVASGHHRPGPSRPHPHLSAAQLLVQPVSPSPGHLSPGVADSSPSVPSPMPGTPGTRGPRPRALGRPPQDPVNPERRDGRPPLRTTTTSRQKLMRWML